MTSTIIGEIVLINGKQAGARAKIKANSTLTVSGNLETDICIQDKHISNETLRLVSEHNKIYIQTVSGKIEVNGKNISHSKKIKLSDNAKIKIGNTIFVCKKTLNVPFLKIVDDCNKKQNTMINKQKSLNKKINNKIIINALLMILIIIASVLYISKNKMQKENLYVSEMQKTKNLLHSNGFSNLKIKKNDNDQIVISGYVLSYKDKAVIENIIDDNAIPAIHKLKIGDQLAKEVTELFRINGVDVKATALVEGIINVTVNNYDKNIVNKIKHVALKEITDLDSLEIKYKTNKLVKKSIGKEVTYSDYDKKITMVVDGDPAYIMTSDDAKYYIGALLPTGYKVVDIIDQQVVLEKHGKQTTLNF
jgi:type III secretion protein D